MSKSCLKCGGVIPWGIVVDGKPRNLSCRKYCLECSPFGSRNTKRIHINRSEITCKYCGKQPRRGRVCDACIYRRRCDKRLKPLYDITGTACWHCGYDKGMAAISVLDFHHMKDKKFQLNSSAANYKWDKIWKEVQKCVLLCACCHREVHAGLIAEGKIEKIYSDKWKDISSKQTKEKYARFRNRTAQPP